MSIKMNLTPQRNKKTDKTRAFRFKKDDEWYTTAEDVFFFIKNVKISKNKIIWCPFDTKESNFVKVLKKEGYKVVFSHISEGKDFYKYEPKKWDIIISNPPFNKKERIIKRIIELGSKPFALIFGIQCLNSERFCAQLQNLPRVQYLHLNRRMCFTKDVKNYDVFNLKRPSFASMWICNNLLPKDIMVLYGVNYKNDNKEFN